MHKYKQNCKRKSTGRTRASPAGTCVTCYVTESWGNHITVTVVTVSVTLVTHAGTVRGYKYHWLGGVGQCRPARWQWSEGRPLWREDRRVSAASRRTGNSPAGNVTDAGGRVSDMEIFDKAHISLDFILDKFVTLGSKTSFVCHLKSNKIFTPP